MHLDTGESGGSLKLSMQGPWIMTSVGSIKNLAESSAGEELQRYLAAAYNCMGEKVPGLRADPSGQPIMCPRRRANLQVIRFRLWHP